MDDAFWFESFDKKHGAFVTDGNWVIFCDGACRERGAHGVKKLPPDDPAELRALLLRFWSIRVNELSEKFHAQKDELARAAADGRSAPSTEQLAQLEQLQQQVLKAQEHAETLQDDAEADADREYCRASQIYKQWQKALRKIEQARRLSAEAREAGKSGEADRLTKLCERLKIDCNEQGRQWRSCSGEARHRIVMEETSDSCQEATKKLDQIEI